MRIPTDSDLTTAEGLEKISSTFVEEMQSELTNNIKEINSEDLILRLAAQAAEEEKIFVIYMYDDDAGVDYTMQAVSMDPWLKDDFRFASLFKPSKQFLEDQPKLPLI